MKNNWNAASGLMQPRDTYHSGYTIDAPRDERLFLPRRCKTSSARGHLARNPAHRPHNAHDVDRLPALFGNRARRVDAATIRLNPQHRHHGRVWHQGQRRTGGHLRASLRRFCSAMAHSARTLSKPRIRNWRNPRACFDLLACPPALIFTRIASMPENFPAGWVCVRGGGSLAPGRAGNSVSGPAGPPHGRRSPPWPKKGEGVAKPRPPRPILERITPTPFAAIIWTGS
jgi:hypothetical protein